MGSTSESRRLVVGTEIDSPLEKNSLSPSRLKNFLVRRARVLDDPGRSPQIELEPERSFGGPLSGQSVCEQTSGVLRHTESVRDDKVQEQDWRQALEQKSHAPPGPPKRRHHCTVSLGAMVSDIQVRTLRTVADTRSNDPVRSQASSENKSVSATAAQGPWRRTTRPQVSEALFLLCLISSSSQVARPPAHAAEPRPAQPQQVSREVCVCSGCSGSLASLMEVPADRDDRHRPVQHRLVAALLAGVLWLVWWVAPDSEESSFHPDGMVRTLRR